MIFRKISDTELRCSLTDEEIRAYGLQVSDFLCRSDKSIEFLEHLMEEGQEETGFEQSGPMSVEGILFQNKLELIFRAIDVDQMENLEKGELPFFQTSAADADAQPDFKNDSTEILQLMQVRFSSLDRLLTFCRLLTFPETVRSLLYAEDDGYVLLADLDACSRTQLGAFCMLVNEYASGSIYGDLPASHLMEHGELICEEPIRLLPRLSSVKN